MATTDLAVPARVGAEARESGCEAPGVAHEEEPAVRLERWTGPWEEDDPDANFKADVALYSLLDPLSTIRNLGAGLDMPGGCALSVRVREMGDGRKRWAA